jgi:hypothetical protein
MPTPPELDSSSLSGEPQSVAGKRAFVRPLDSSLKVYGSDFDVAAMAMKMAYTM